MDCADVVYLRCCCAMLNYRFLFPIKVLFDSWRSSSHHLWDHSSRQCQQLWRQQSLVSTIPLYP